MEAAAGVYRSIIFPEPHVGVPPAKLLSAQKAMLDATPDCIKVLSRDGRLLTMNRAGCLALGVPEDSEFGMPWLPLLPAAVHAKGAEALSKAALGSSARFPGQSEVDGDVRYWDNLLTPIVDAGGGIASILCISRDVTEKTRLEKELESAILRERLLSREMQHRIKNLFSVVSGLISIAEKEAASFKAPEKASAILREKIIALSRASDAAFSQTETQRIDAAAVDAGTLIKSVLQPYGDRCQAIGDEASINWRNTTTIALFLHEFATNSVKYGALSAADGHISVHWKTEDDGAFRLTWAETGGPSLVGVPRNLGFGSQMVDRIVRSAGGQIVKTWQTQGLLAELMLPNVSA